MAPPSGFFCIPYIVCNASREDKDVASGRALQKLPWFPPRSLILLQNTKNGGTGSHNLCNMSKKCAKKTARLLHYWCFSGTLFPWRRVALSAPVIVWMLAPCV